MKLLTVVLVLYASFCLAITNERLLKLQERSGGSFIKLTKSNFNEVLAGPRNATIITLLTATNPEIGCSTCQNIAPAFQQLVDSWSLDHPDGDGLFFARADLAEGHPDIFQALRLNNVPKLYVYGPTNDSTPLTEGFEVWNVPQSIDFVDHVVATIAEKLGKRVDLHQPVQWGSIAITVGSVMLFLWLLQNYSRYFILLITSKTLWGGFAVFLILIFTTGYMFNNIRGMPFIMQDDKGLPKYFVQGQQQQLGIETQVISAIYGMLALSVVFLVIKAPGLADARVRFGIVLYLLGLNIVLFSVFLSIFQFKSSGYPFHLLNIWSPK
ncbi:unnamed protein product [Cyberlindnera jadinii]|uniref:Uncharacterized protein n=1 Tax=Cyberlindnera jadinii (strain ATCC 18201 / CBS 1600 / BCRC 20928 / JCM 3617 / NBRC 0987 / NRRL Y-1542) TaxID=983966 RepID=A0A0H5BZ54_CYBJN|nr:unnamed protein product [Cyberlindnera jadinii]